MRPWIRHLPVMVLLALTCPSCGQGAAGVPRAHSTQATRAKSSDPLASILRDSRLRLSDLPTGSVLEPRGSAVATLIVCGAEQYFWHRTSERTQSRVFSNRDLSIAAVAGIFRDRLTANRAFTRMGESRVVRCYRRIIRRNILYHINANSVGAARTRILNLVGVSAKASGYQISTPAEVLVFPVVIGVDVAAMQVGRIVWLFAVWGVGPTERFLESAAGSIVKRLEKPRV